MNIFKYYRFLVPFLVRQSLKGVRDLYGWPKSGFEVPAPIAVKNKVLKRNGIPDAIWIETGTYAGSTAKLFAKNSIQVYTIEPSPKYFLLAARRLRKYKNVIVINSVSEVALPKIVSNLHGDVNFWLDGHFSGGATFHSDLDTPILKELETIAQYLQNFRKLVVVIDDLRCFGSFNPEYTQYPPKEYLVNWANNLNLNWHIEFDIFVAQNFITGQGEKP